MFSLKEAASKMMFFILFIVFFAIVLCGLKWLQAFIEPHNPYSKPQSNAVKAFHTFSEEHRQSSMLDRLFLFYLHGEN